MQRDKRLTAPFILITIGFIFSVLIPKIFPNDANLATCYHGTVGNSSSLFQISEQSASDIKGSLIFQNYEKDSSYGDFVGKYEDNKLTASFTFQSEGTESVREIIFTKDANNLAGDGFTYTPSENCTSILYNQGLGLIPFDMKFDLHTDDRLYCAEMIYKAFNKSLDTSHFFTTTIHKGFEYVSTDNIFGNNKQRFSCLNNFFKNWQHVTNICDLA